MSCFVIYMSIFLSSTHLIDLLSVTSKSAVNFDKIIWTAVIALLEMLRTLIIRIVRTSSLAPASELAFFVTIGFTNLLAATLLSKISRIHTLLLACWFALDSLRNSNNIEINPCPPSAGYIIRKSVLSSLFRLFLPTVALLLLSQVLVFYMGTLFESLLSIAIFPLASSVARVIIDDLWMIIFHYPMDFQKLSIAPSKNMNSLILAVIQGEFRSANSYNEIVPRDAAKAFQDSLSHPLWHRILRNQRDFVDSLIDGISVIGLGRPLVPALKAPWNQYLRRIGRSLALQDLARCSRQSPWRRQPLLQSDAFFHLAYSMCANLDTIILQVPNLDQF